MMTWNSTFHLGILPSPFSELDLNLLHVCSPGAVWGVDTEDAPAQAEQSQRSWAPNSWRPLARVKRPNPGMRNGAAIEESSNVLERLFKTKSGYSGSKLLKTAVLLINSQILLIIESGNESTANQIHDSKTKIHEGRRVFSSMTPGTVSLRKEGNSLHWVTSHANPHTPSPQLLPNIRWRNGDQEARSPSDSCESSFSILQTNFVLVSCNALPSGGREFLNQKPLT